jgi:hypothetical protein
MTTKNGAWLDLPLLGGNQWVTKESNPIAWAYMHGSDLGGNLDQAQLEAWEESLRPRRPRDWHRGLRPYQWRCRDGAVVAIWDMTDTHLGNAIRFAENKPQHSSRLGVLRQEAKRRQRKEQS